MESANSPNQHRKVKKNYSAAVLLVIASTAAACGAGIPNDLLICCLCAVLAAAALAGAILYGASAFCGLVGIVSAAIVFIVTGDFVAALFSLAFLPAAYMLVYKIRTNSEKTSVVVWCALTFGIYFAVFVLADFYLIYGQFTQNNFDEYLRRVLSLDEVKQIFAELAAYSSLPAEFQNSDALTIYIKSIMPGVFGAAALILAYLATHITGFFSRLLQSNDDYFRSRKWRIRMSSVSGVILVISYLISMFLPGIMTTASVVLMNLIILLTPGYYLCGLSALLTMFVSKRRFTAGLIYVFMGIAIVVSIVFSFLIVLIVCLGLLDNMRVRKPNNINSNKN